VEPNEALNDNKTYAVVWQVLQALRSHDDRFDAMVNKLDLIGRDTSKMEVVAITDKIQRKQEKPKGLKNKDAGKGGFTLGEPEPKRYGKEDQTSLPFEIGEIEKAIYAKLVQKVGNRHHWEDWANDIAKIARTHIDRITAIVEDPANEKELAAFNAFAEELRADLNGSISDGEIIEMLAQHLITKPVFDALFEDYSFAQHNPMSLAMQGVLDVLQEHRLDKEADIRHPVAKISQMAAWLRDVRFAWGNALARARTSSSDRTRSRPTSAPPTSFFVTDSSGFRSTISRVTANRNICFKSASSTFAVRSLPSAVMLSRMSMRSPFVTDLASISPMGSNTRRSNCARV
jgi:hypothetical protein